MDCEQQQEEVQESKYNGPCFIIIRFPLAQEQACRNSLAKWSSVHNNYTGSVSGVSCGPVCRMEGNWREDQGIALILFETWETALRWSWSVPEIKQQDWLWGPDMIMVPVNNWPKCGMNTIQMLELECYDYGGLREEYSSGADKILCQHGAIQVVGTDSIKKLRGLWQPQYLVINCWDSGDCLHKACHSAENQELVSKRQSYASTHSCCFTLKPLFRPR